MLKILTLNINLLGDRHGPWDRRKPLAAALIHEFRPDIVALQAVRQQAGLHGGNQAHELAGLLPKYRHVVFRPGTQYDDGAADGMAILASIPIDSIDVLPLSRREGIEDPWRRIVLSARFLLSTGPFHLFNGHFSWVQPQAQDNVRETLPAINAAEGLRMLVGDFNSTADCESMQMLARAGWVDAWAALRGNEPGYTFESNAPSSRIDYAWVPGEYRQNLESIHIVGRETTGGVRLSDHCGLLVKIRRSVARP